VLKPLVLGLCGSLAAGTLLAAGPATGVTDAPLSAGVATPAATPVATSEQPAVGTQFVPNAGFSRGVDGWKAWGRLVVTPAGLRGGMGARLTSTELQPVVVTTRPRAVASSAVGSVFQAGAWVRSSQLSQRVALVVRELVDGRVTAEHRARIKIETLGWHFVTLRVHPESRRSSLNVRVRANNQRPNDRFMVDNVTLRIAALPASACTLSRRGIPSSACGPLMGAAFGSNTDPTPWEAELGRPLGVRRTYWGPNHVGSAVRVAKEDIAAHRIPWISFKLPHGWANMAAGKGNAWARDLATRLREVGGPVWVAFHHEPEGDGNIAAWKAMQERLAPIVRRVAPNVAYTAILMGWHQVSGDPRYDLDTIWPDTKIDIAGFDPYNWYGTLRRNGLADRNHADMKKIYFDPISRWADSKGIEWAVAETGYTDLAHELDPMWLPRTLHGLKADHGIALTYFNSPLNSEASWTWVLDSPGKKAAFARTIARTAQLP
jgi:hypothetical protein